MIMNYGHIIAFGAAITLTAGGFVATATPAVAASEDLQVSVHAVPTRLVHFGDLDLTVPAAQKKLNRRVAVAVNAVCEGSESYATFQSDGLCRTASWNRARPQIARAIDNARRVASNGGKLANDAVIAI